MQINSNCKSALKYKKIDKMHTQMKKLQFLGRGFCRKLSILWKAVYFMVHIAAAKTTYAQPASFQCCQLTKK